MNDASGIEIRQAALKKTLSVGAAYVVLLGILLVTGTPPKYLPVLVIYWLLLTIVTFTYCRRREVRKLGFLQSVMRRSAVIVLIIIVPMTLLAAQKSGQISMFAGAVYAFAIGIGAVLATDRMR